MSTRKRRRQEKARRARRERGARKRAGLLAGFALVLSHLHNEAHWIHYSGVFHFPVGEAFVGIGLVLVGIVSGLFALLGGMSE